MGIEFIFKNVMVRLFVFNHANIPNKSTSLAAAFKKEKSGFSFIYSITEKAKT